MSVYEAKSKEAINGRPVEHKPAEELLLTYVPRATRHLLDFNGTGILRPGNVCTIIGPAGYGKSQVFESLISSYLNPYVDTLGLRVADHDGRPLLWIDGERTKDDIAHGFARIKRRIRIEDNPDLIEGDRFRGVNCFPLIEYADIPARVKELERLIFDLSPGLVILDGAGDFVRDPNDLPASVDFVALLIALANSENFAAVVSIHPNPGGGQDNKARGHLGSELLRKSESVLLLKRAPDNRDIRILTMDFGHGKNRNQADNLEHAFAWNDEHKMFMSCQYTPPVRTGKTEDQQEAFNAILTDGKQMSYSELCEALKARGMSHRTATRWIEAGVEKEMIFNSDGKYKIVPF